MKPCGFTAGPPALIVYFDIVKSCRDKPRWQKSHQTVCSFRHGCSQLWGHSSAGLCLTALQSACRLPRLAGLALMANPVRSDLVFLLKLCVQTPRPGLTNLARGNVNGSGVCHKVILFAQVFSHTCIFKLKLLPPQHILDLSFHHNISWTCLPLDCVNINRQAAYY